MLISTVQSCYQLSLWVSVCSISNVTPSEVKPDLVSCVRRGISRVRKILATALSFKWDLFVLVVVQNSELRFNENLVKCFKTQFVLFPWKLLVLIAVKLQKVWFSQNHISRTNIFCIILHFNNFTTKFTLIKVVFSHMSETTAHVSTEGTITVSVGYTISISG